MIGIGKGQPALFGKMTAITYEIFIKSNIWKASTNILQYIV